MGRTRMATFVFVISVSMMLATAASLNKYSTSDSPDDYTTTTEKHNVPDVQDSQPRILVKPNPVSVWPEPLTDCSAVTLSMCRDDEYKEKPDWSTVCYVNSSVVQLCSPICQMDHGWGSDSPCDRFCPDYFDFCSFTTTPAVPNFDEWPHGPASCTNVTSEMCREYEHLKTTAWNFSCFVELGPLGEVKLCPSVCTYGSELQCEHRCQEYLDRCRPKSTRPSTLKISTRSSTLKISTRSSTAKISTRSSTTKISTRSSTAKIKYGTPPSKDENNLASLLVFTLLVLFASIIVVVGIGCLIYRSIYGRR